MSECYWCWSAKNKCTELATSYSGTKQTCSHSLFHALCGSMCTAKRKFETNIPRKGTVRLQSQFLHSCFCERFIYSSDRSAAGNLEIGTEAAQFLFWENINSNFFALCQLRMPNTVPTVRRGSFSAKDVPHSGATQETI